MAKRQYRRRLTSKQVQGFADILLRERREPHGPDTLRDIDEAMKRISDGTYGICPGTGKPINKRRLMAIPWAKYSIEYAKLMEQGLEFSNAENEFPDDSDAFAA